MKNFIRYSFSILIMISCVVLFAIVSFKVLIVDSLSEDTPAEAPSAQEELSGGNDESKEEKMCIRDRYIISYSAWS